MKILSTLRRIFHRPISCSEAGRIGNAVRHERERAKIRAKTIDIANRIGRPDLVEGLQ